MSRDTAAAHVWREKNIGLVLVGASCALVWSALTVAGYLI